MCGRCFLCGRYSNLDFGWKRSIDSKTFISCPESCSKDCEALCQHQETVTPNPSPPAPLSSPHSPLTVLDPLVAPGPIDTTCTRNLINGTAQVAHCDDTGHKVEHLHKQICQRPQAGPTGPEPIQTSTSVPVQPSVSLKIGSSPPGPRDECTPGRTTDDTDKATSVCKGPVTGPSAPTAPSPGLAAVPLLRAQDSPKSLGPNPGLILQALTLSNASDGFNLERLEMLGDSFLKHAITTYLFCTYPDAHEGRLSYMRSKKVRQTDLIRKKHEHAPQTLLSSFYAFVRDTCAMSVCAD